MFAGGAKRNIGGRIKANATTTEKKAKTNTSDIRENRSTLGKKLA